jgi:hypothetical protein
MIHTQDNGHADPFRFYAYCRCGVVSPLRREYEAAEADETAHASVCSASLQRWAAIQMLKAIAIGLALGLAVCLVILVIAAITGGVQWT